MTPRDLLVLRPQGLYCPLADVYIDPRVAVPRAVITHAHSDHCRPGHGAILASPATAALALARYGDGAFDRVQTLNWGDRLSLGGARLWLAPAGHVLGSAQVVIEAGGARAVVSGDYKRRADPSCDGFELVPCDLFVTEATFGLPVFRHPPAQGEIARLLASLATFPDRAHAIGAYSLGKAQRLILELRAVGYDRPIWLHGALVKLCDVYARFGHDLGPLASATGARELGGQIVLAPPGALTEKWVRRLGEPVIGAASGWMQVRQRARQGGVELALVISDHADWDGLTRTITETGARDVWVTHGAEEALCHWATGQGMRAQPLAIAGRGDGGD